MLLTRFVKVGIVFAAPIAVCLTLSCSNAVSEYETDFMLVGDWLMIEESSPYDNYNILATDYFNSFISFGASGEVVWTNFEGPGNIWIEWGSSGKWRTKNQKLYLFFTGDSNESNYRYDISDDILRIFMDFSNETVTSTYHKSNPADFRSAHSPIYGQDAALYDIWVLSTDEEMVLDLYLHWLDVSYYFNDNHEYGWNWYTVDDRLFLLGVDCRRYIYYDDEYDNLCVPDMDEITETVELDYKITTTKNGKKTLTLRRVNHDGTLGPEDIWIPG